MSAFSKSLAECPSSIDASYNCENPFPNCTSSFGFQFSSLWTISQNINGTCSADWRIFDPQTASISQPACEQIAGSTWSFYPGASIWARLTTWKFPLLQLVAIFPRPPLSLRVETFVIFHLLGNPVSTVRDLVVKFASCQRRAEYWRDCLNSLGNLVRDTHPIPRYDNWTRKWKALAIITDSYDEWGPEKGDAATAFLHDQLTSGASDEEKQMLLAICQKTGNALAADRTTKFFPVLVAECFFIGTVAIAVGRTEAAAEVSNPSTYINIEAYSIAFTAVYFWIIPAVLLASVIGVSQTENAIPRILQRLQTDITYAFPHWTTSLPNNHLTADDVEGRPDAALRERNGGIYSWQPMQSRNANATTSVHIFGPAHNTLKSFMGRAYYSIVDFARIQPGSPVFALAVVAAGTITGCIISWLVPPIGFECRHIGIILIYEAWLINAALDYISWGDYHRSRFWFTFTKDCLTTIATMGGIIATQVGIFNRCSCYTLWGKTGLALPQIVPIAETLVYRIATVYPAIAFLCVGFELVVFPALIALQYPHAIRVYLQRDDNSSNMQLWHDILDDWYHEDGFFCRRWIRKVSKKMRRWVRSSEIITLRRSVLARRTSSTVGLLPPHA